MGKYSLLNETAKLINLLFYYYSFDIKSIQHITLKNLSDNGMMARILLKNKSFS